MFINKITNVKNMGSYFIEFKNTVAKEQTGEHGLSHLVEHCMCEKVKDLEKKFNECGITWNAYTSSTNVCFFMSGLVKSVKKFIPSFTEKILNYTITQDVFEREKKIVISEYLMYYNENYECFTNNWFRKHYNYPKEIGVLEELQNITYEKFMKFKNKFFKNPDNIIFIHPKTISDITELKNITFNLNNKDKIYNFLKFDTNYNNYPMEYYSTGINSQRLLMFGYNINCKNTENFDKLHTLTSMFNYFMCAGLSSYLYQEIREKYACVYSINTFGHIFENKKQLFIGYICETEEKNVELLTKVINKCLKKLMKNITFRKFNSIYKSFKSKYKIQANIDFDSFNYFCDEDIHKVIEYIMNNKITYAEFKEFAQKFIDNYVIYNDINYIPSNFKEEKN